MANQRIPIPHKNLSEKDTDLISKMATVAKAVHVDEPPMFGIDLNEEYDEIEDYMRRGDPVKKRILVDEVYKILFYNNIDPETYTINFWSDFFEIDAATIRNIVNYMAYPIVDPKTKKVKEILYFKDTELAAQAHLLGELDRTQYLGFLELDYYNRVKEEYKDEIGLFGKMDLPTYLD